MVTFACKKIPQEDLIRCSFDIKKTPYNLLIFLLGQKDPMKINEIAKQMGLERSSIQKAIRVLLEKDLIIRSQKNLDNGGYIYLYRTKNKQEIKQRMRDIITSWYENTKKEIERL